MDVSEIVIDNEASIRLGCFAAVLIVMLLWELVAPRRALRVSKSRRWASNFGVMVLNTIVVRLLFPAAALGAGLYAASRGWGLFNQINTPLWISTALCVLALDIVIYLQHRLLVIPFV